MSETTDKIQKLALFKDLSEETIVAVQTKIETKDIQPGHTIIHQGEDANEAFLILNGTVEVWSNSHGTDSLIDTMTEGIFGEMGLLYNAKRSCTLKAKTTVSLGVLNQSSFVDLCNRFPVLKSKIEDLAAERLRRFKENLSTLGDDLNFTANQISCFREIFTMVDENNNGEIDQTEMRKLLSKLSSHAIPDDDFQSFWQRVDSDKSGEVSFEEFLKGLPVLKSYLDVRISLNDMKKLELFSGINDTDLEWIRGQLSARIFKDRETIIKQGDDADRLYWILNGRVEVFLQEGSVEKSIDTQDEGVFGEMGLLYNSKRRCTLKACPNAMLGMLDKSLFASLCKKFPSVLKRLEALGAQHMERFKETLLDSSLDSFSASQIQHFKEIFTMVDADNSGAIDKNELKELLSKLCGGLPEEKFVQCYNKMDSDGDGSISFDEFLEGLPIIKNYIQPANKKQAVAQTQPKLLNRTSSTRSSTPIPLGALVALCVVLFGLVFTI